MKRTTLMITMAAFTCFLAAGTAQADSSSASSIAGGGMPSNEKIPSDMRTDLSGGEQGLIDEYATTPVRQGSLTEVKDSKWLNQPVTNAKGEKLGKIIKMMRDGKTQNIEYVFFHVADTKYARPMRWSQFEQKGDKLMLNMTKEQLLPPVNRTEVKDMSPDLAMYMDEIEQKRAESKPFVGPGDGRGTNRPVPSAGAQGEDRAAGNLGDRGAPPGPAPQFENEAAKKKQ
ncbi:MAG TPA: PRC-barrel domain-containing protein [Nitrospira sp.]|nr:PRC-barrel domain-containing protein [Nitrospira sp.]